MRTRFLISAIMTVALLSVGGSALAQSRKLCGKVLLREGGKTEAGENVTAYVKSCSCGTITDRDGNFSLSIPDGKVPSGKITVEFSLMGFSTQEKTLTLEKSGISSIDTVILELQSLMLPAAYLIDGGMPEGDYIISKVWDKADENRKKMSAYNADVRYSVSTHEIPVVAGILNGVEKGAVKFAASFTSLGDLVRYCMSNDDVSAEVTMGRVVGYGTTKDFNKKITFGGKSLPNDVADDILNFPEGIDFFEAVYNRGNLWGEKFAKKHHFELIGTYEYGDKLVDVLRVTDHRKIITVKLHVVEQEWGVLRMEVGRESEVMLFECRDIGEGIYMPVSLVMKPTLSLVRNSEIPAVIKNIQENKYMTKGMKRRSTSILQERYESGRDFNPYITAGFNISYTVL